MPPTVSGKNYSLINDCSDSTTFTGSTPANVTDFYKEGSACVGFTMKASGNNDTYDTVTLDLTGKHLHMWFMCTALKEMNTAALGGVQIFLYDGTNTGYYYMLGSDTYPGGWYNLALDCDRAPDAGTQPTLSAITRIGLRVNLTTTSKNVQNTWLDHIYTGDGLIVYGTTSFGLDDIASVDASTTYGWGMIRKISGIYFMVGSLDIGDSAGTTGVTFSDTSKVLVFENRKVSKSIYAVNVVGNSTGTNSITFGEKSGTQGIKGCVIRSAEVSQEPKWSFTATDTDVQTMQLYGCTLSDYISVSLPTYNSSNPTYREVISTTFDGGHGAIAVSTCTVKYCNIVASGGIGVSISSTSHRFSDSSIIACGIGCDFTTTGSYSLSNVLFTSCTYDVGYSGTSGSLSLSATGTSNPSTTQNLTHQSADKAWVYDPAPTYTDETTDLASDTRNDVAPLADCDEANDAIYVGVTAAIATSLAFKISTPGVGTWTVTWEYYNGAWTALSGVTDGTTGFTAATGFRTVTFTLPGDATSYSVNGSTQYWIRGRISAYTSTTTNPLVARAWCGKTNAITVTNTKTLTVTCLNEAGFGVENTNVRIETTGGTLISEGATDGDGIYEDATYNYGGSPVAVYVIVRKKGYVFNPRVSSQITENGISVPFTVIRDKAVALP